jgi:predicted  nucleic acid-binding Zn-ribbon protein
MVHTCVTCGRVYPDSSPEILSGCSGCGGKKFYFERPVPRQKLSPHPSPPPAGAERPEDAGPAPVDEDRSPRVESIRIIAPGTYELNIEKMAECDDRVVGLGREGSYAVDLLSMAGKKKKKKS